MDDPVVRWGSGLMAGWTDGWVLGHGLVYG